MTNPIKPSDVPGRLPSFPDEVFDVFNQLIVDHFDGTRAVITQDEVVLHLCDRLHISRTTIFDKRYLDVERAYRDAGWVVEYDKPGYNETYPATFTFKRPTP